MPSGHTRPMPFPRRLLGDDEDVVLDLHPHWKALVLPVLVLLVLGAAGGFGVAVTGSTPAVQVALVVLALILVVVFVLVPLLRWRTTHFVVSDRRVLVRSGVLARSGRDVPLSRINDITFSHSLLERMLGCGTLVIESAGERGQVVLRDVPRVEQVQRTVYDLVEDTDARLRTDRLDDR